MIIAVTTVDPGTTSGVARGVVDTDAPSVWDSLAQTKVESWEATGALDEQAWEIMGEFADWARDRARFQIPAFLVCEAFVLRQQHGTDRLLDPVRVTGGLVALARKRDGDTWVELNFQQPADAKNFATNARLRSAGLWVKGSEHRRDAVRHFALAAARAGKLGGAASPPAA